MISDFEPCPWAIIDYCYKVRMAGSLKYLYLSLEGVLVARTKAKHLQGKLLTVLAAQIHAAYPYGYLACAPSPASETISY